MNKKIGIIGGSGLYDLLALKDKKNIKIETPFGDPSDEFMCGLLGGREVVFLPRHGRGHRILPSEINFRANIYGMKKLGVTNILSVSAVGSMKEEIAPGHMVVPDQFFDRTKNRASTFFGRGIVGHLSFADPLCPRTIDLLYNAGKESGAVTHKGGTYICIEGPQFSTKAESNIFRKWGVDVIGMTNVTEAKLAREAEICYGTLALATDYDCWYEEEENVTVEAVIEVMKKNVATAQKIIEIAVPMVDLETECSCHSAMKNSIMTAKEKIPAKVREDLKIIFGKYIYGDAH